LEEDYAQLYASFAHALIDCFSEDTEIAIHKKLRETVYRPSSGHYYMWLEKKYSYIRKDFGLYNSQIIYSENPRRVPVPRQQLMMLVFLLFESVEEFCNYLPSDKKLMNAFNSELKKQHINLLSSYRKTIVLVEKPERGTKQRQRGNQKFICTASALVSDTCKNV
jgi:hypothetical protein